MPIRRRVGALLLAFSLLTGVGVALASPVSAKTYVASGVKIRSGPTTSSTVYGLGYPGHNVVEHFFAQGSTVTGCSSYYGCVTSNWWSNHTNTSTGVRGYSWAYYISN